MNAPKLPADRLKYRRPITEILSDLSRPVPQKFLATRTQGGKKLTYIPWHHAARFLDWYAPGWEGSVKDIRQVGNLVVVTYAITIHAQEGSFTREATGQEILDKNFTDAVCAAEQQAFKRACARFGLGLELYNDNGGSETNDVGTTPYKSQG